MCVLEKGNLDDCLALVNVSHIGRANIWGLIIKNETQGAIDFIERLIDNDVSIDEILTHLDYTKRPYAFTKILKSTHKTPQVFKAYLQMLTFMIERGCSEQDFIRHNMMLNTTLCNNVNKVIDSKDIFNECLSLLS